MNDSKRTAILDQMAIVDHDMEGLQAQKQELQDRLAYLDTGIAIGDVIEFKMGKQLSNKGKVLESNPYYRNTHTFVVQRILKDGKKGFNYKVYPYDLIGKVK